VFVQLHLHLRPLLIQSNKRMYKRRSLTGIRLRHRSRAQRPCKGSACRILPPRFPCRPRPPPLHHNLVLHHSMGAMRRTRRLLLQRRQCTRCVHRRNHRSQIIAQSLDSSTSPWSGCSRPLSKAYRIRRVDNTHTRQVLLIKSVSQSWLVYGRQRQHLIPLQACYDVLPEASCKYRPLTCSCFTDPSQVCMYTLSPHTTRRAAIPPSLGFLLASAGEPQPPSVA
jgi:hypothetical protein